MSIGSDLKNSISGNIETALLVIHDYRDSARQLQAGGGSREAALLKTKADRLKATAERLSDITPPSLPGSQDRMLKVQFNPSQLSLYASAIPKTIADAASGQSRTIVPDDAKNLTLTTVLYFDDMDTYDSFMWEKFTSGLTMKEMYSRNSSFGNSLKVSSIHNSTCGVIGIRENQHL